VAGDLGLLLLASLDAMRLFFVRVNQVLVRLWARVMRLGFGLAVIPSFDACLTGCLSRKRWSPNVGRRGFRGVEQSCWLIRVGSVKNRCWMNR
jgi:hypothetical protein